MTTGGSAATSGVLGTFASSGASSSFSSLDTVEQRRSNLSHSAASDKLIRIQKPRVKCLNGAMARVQIDRTFIQRYNTLDTKVDLAYVTFVMVFQSDGIGCPKVRYGNLTFSNEGLRVLENASSMQRRYLDTSEGCKPLCQRSEANGEGRL